MFLHHYQANMTQEETVFKYIKKAIIENRLPPGTRLREQKLAEIFSVKRGLIRKVLARLVNQKLVDHQQNIGAQVAIPSLKDGQDLFATRQILEQAVIRQLCQQITDQQISILRQSLNKEQQAYKSGDHKLGLQLSIDFHQALAQFTGHQLITEFLHDIFNRTPLVILSQPGDNKPDGCVNHEHSDIVDALENRDSLKAVALMQKISPIWKRCLTTGLKRPQLNWQRYSINDPDLPPGYDRLRPTST